MSLFLLTAGLATPWPNCNFCGWGGVGWGGNDDVPWTCTHAGCYATAFVLSSHTRWMLRNRVGLVIAHMLDATRLCRSCHCTHAGCYATVFVLSSHTRWMLRNRVGLVIAHTLDATQLCLSCHRTHAGCYATVLVLSLHICWMLRNCVGLVIARMLDATQLSLSCLCTHAGCYATVLVLSLPACWMLRNCVCLVIARMLDATQPCWSCLCTHAGCYATVLVLSLHACWMLRNCVGWSLHTCWMLHNCVCLVIAYTLDATQLRWSCHCTHAGCYATVFVLSLHTTREDGDKMTSFFRRMVPIHTNTKLNAFVKTRTHGKNGTKWTSEPTGHKLKSTPLQHFVHIAQGRNHGRNLFFPYLWASKTWLLFKRQIGNHDLQHPGMIF